MINACSCGCTETHPIATRETADERHVTVWSDGTITHGRTKLGALLRGLGRPTTGYARNRRARAVRLLLDDLGLLDLAEIAPAVKRAERGFRMGFIAPEFHRSFVFRSLRPTSPAQ
jgi:hypothetical protein